MSRLNYIIFSMKIDVVLANSADPDEISLLSLPNSSALRCAFLFPCNIPPNNALGTGDCVI